MDATKKRYVFTEFSTLQQADFEKLKRVCDKLFVLIDQQEQHIPLSLVLAMQQMGKNAKWVVVPTASGKLLDYHLCYLLGKLDEKLSDDIEFVILSDKGDFDSLIDFVNFRGRDCLRVTLSENGDELETTEEEEVAYLSQNDQVDEFETETDLQVDLTETIDVPTSPAYETTQVIRVASASTTNTADLEKKAEETVKRLKYTGNRPMEVVLLRDYISLFHQELEEENGQADQIINKLVENKFIEVRKGVIKYNF